MSELKHNGDHYCSGDPDCLMCQVVTLTAQLESNQAEGMAVITKLEELEAITKTVAEDEDTPKWIKLLLEDK